MAWNLHVLLDDDAYWFELRKWVDRIESQLKLVKDIMEGRRWRTMRGGNL